MDCSFGTKNRVVRASIDIGTNTVLLLVASEKNGQLNVVHEEQRVPRLGAGVDESKNLSGNAIKRVVEALKDYQQILNQQYPSVKSIKVTATSAVRDAKNKREFIEIINNETGLTVDILSGFEEAQYTFKGAKSVLLNQFTRKENVVIDIGGGSTEIAAGNNRLRDRYSYNIGCVRFTERFLEDDPPSLSQIMSCRKAIQETLEDYEFNFVDNASLIGVAGTVTSLAFIDKELESYDSSKIAGHILTIERLGNYIKRFQKWPSVKLVENYPIVMEGRADIFLAGLIILKEFMLKYKFGELITSTGGIRHGVLLNSE